MALLRKALIALVAIGALLSPSGARSQTLADFLISGMPAENRAEAQTLAICIVAEAGGSRVDHAGILHVLQRRARALSRRSGQYVSTPEMARRYCRIFRDPPKHRTFILGFKWNGKPRKQYERAWTAAQLSVVLFMLQVDYDPCDGKAMHWGSTADSKRGKPKNTIPVFCGPTRNLFWSGPQRGTTI